MKSNVCWLLPLLLLLPLIIHTKIYYGIACNPTCNPKMQHKIISSAICFFSSSVFCCLLSGAAAASLRFVFVLFKLYHKKFACVCLRYLLYFHFIWDLFALKNYPRQIWTRNNNSDAKERSERKKNLAANMYWYVHCYGPCTHSWTRTVSEQSTLNSTVLTHSIAATTVHVPRTPHMPYE